MRKLIAGKMGYVHIRFHVSGAVLRGFNVFDGMVLNGKTGEFALGNNGSDKYSGYELAGRILRVVRPTGIKAN